MMLSNIKIRESFKRTPPGQEKMNGCREYFKRHGIIDRDLVVDRNGYLVDGYVGYLVLLENGIKEYGVVFKYDLQLTHTYIAENTYRTRDTTYVFGCHTLGGKEYVWRLTKNSISCENIHAGSKALVNTRNGNRTVNVNRVETLPVPPVASPVKKVIRWL